MMIDFDVPNQIPRKGVLKECNGWLNNKSAFHPNCWSVYCAAFPDGPGRTIVFCAEVICQTPFLRTSTNSPIA